MPQIWGHPALNVRRTLVADLLAESNGDVLQIRTTLRSMLEGALLLTLLANTKVDVPVNLGTTRAQYPKKPSGPTYPSRPKSKVCKNPAPAGTRHPEPGTLLKKFPGFCQKKKVCISPSCSSCHPVRLKNQDSKTTRTEKYKLLDLVEMKVCISDLTLTQNPNPQKNKSCLKGLGFRVRVRPEKQTLNLAKPRDLL